jgi:hypothetical protein
MYRQGLEVAWQHIHKQKNAFWDAIYASLANRFTQQADQKMFENKGLFPENRLYASKVVNAHYKGSYSADFILENLQKIPLDLIGYTTASMWFLTRPQCRKRTWDGMSMAMPCPLTSGATFGKTATALHYWHRKAMVTTSTKGLFSCCRIIWLIITGCCLYTNQPTFPAISALIL